MMKILTVDIGTGTQDIFLYDSRLDVENGFKMIVPSPTMMVHQRIQQATAQKQDVLLSGRIMGGGPSQWAAEAHLRAGFHIYATQDAARSFNDDLDVIRSMGITIVGEDEVRGLSTKAVHVALNDFDFERIAKAFAHFDVSLADLACVVVGVFDHGDAPPKFSDRQFRFDYLNERILTASQQQDERHPAGVLRVFAYRREHIPPMMTRLQAVADAAGSIDAPLVVMDTAPAAVLGATFDPVVRDCKRVMVANVGNMHTLAFRFGPLGIEGVFEHHTGLLDHKKLDQLLVSLADGSLQHEQVFAGHGHGALLYSDKPFEFSNELFDIAVTGPRRSMMSESSLRPYFAAPFGDMMIAGCFGMLSAAADLLPGLEVVKESLLNPGENAAAPWD